MSVASTGQRPSGMIAGICQYFQNVPVMPRKGPGVTASGDNIVATWLEFRLDAKGMARADVIKEINETLGRNYNNARVYQWVQGQMSAPDAVLELIDAEMVPMLRWLYRSNDWPLKGVNLKKLARALKPAIKLGE